MTVTKRPAQSEILQSGCLQKNEKTDSWHRVSLLESNALEFKLGLGFMLAMTLGKLYNPLVACDLH